MCYNTTQLKQSIIKNKIRGLSDSDQIAALEKQLEELQQQEVTEDYYNAAGFEHPVMLVEVPDQTTYELME